MLGLNASIYKTEDPKTFTIFHIITILKKKINPKEKKTFLNLKKKKKHKCKSFSKTLNPIYTLCLLFLQNSRKISFYQLPQPKAPPLPAPPTRSVQPPPTTDGTAPHRTEPPTSECGAVISSVFQVPKPPGAASGGGFCPPMKTAPHRLFFFSYELPIYIYICIMYVFVRVCFSGIEKGMRRRG